MKKGAATAGGVLAAIVIIFKIISLIGNYNRLYNTPEAKFIKGISAQSGTLTTASGHYFDDSLKKWVVNSNIIAPTKTDSPDSGLNFIRVNTVKFIEEGYTYYALVFTSKGHNTNSRRVLEVFPPLDTYNCDVVVFSATGYSELQNYLHGEDDNILSIKGEGQSSTHNKENKFTEQDYVKTISHIFYDDFFGIKNESNQGSVLLQARGANFLVQKVKEKKEWKVRFLLPDVKAPGNLKDRTILTQKYFECPLDSFKRIIIP